MKVEMKHGKEYFSPSQLKKLYLSVGNFIAYLKRVWQPTSSMELGTLVHERLLEPEKYANKYIVVDDKDIKAEIGGARPTSTKKYKEWMLSAEEEARAKDKIIISGAQEYIVNKIYRDCVMSGVYDEFFTGGEAEITLRAEAEGFEEVFDGLCIIDYDKSDMSIDLKTTSKPIDKFQYDANSLGYDIQAAVTHGMNGKPFVFVVVQTVEPYDIAVFTTSDYFMNRGVTKVNIALENYKHYEDNYSTQVLKREL